MCNDIIHPTENVDIYRPKSELPTARELIDGLTYYIKTAHAHGAFCPEREVIREEVNHWIRHEAPVEGILPFADVVADPQSTLAMAPEYDCGDHLHHSDAGGRLWRTVFRRNMYKICMKHLFLAKNEGEYSKSADLHSIQRMI